MADTFDCDFSLLDRDMLADMHRALIPFCERIEESRDDEPTLLGREHAMFRAFTDMLYVNGWNVDGMDLISEIVEFMLKESEAEFLGRVSESNRLDS